MELFPVIISKYEKIAADLAVDGGLRGAIADLKMNIDINKRISDRIYERAANPAENAVCVGIQSEVMAHQEQAVYMLASIYEKIRYTSSSLGLMLPPGITTDNIVESFVNLANKRFDETKGQERVAFVRITRMFLVQLVRTLHDATVKIRPDIDAAGRRNIAPNSAQIAGTLGLIITCEFCAFSFVDGFAWHSDILKIIIAAYTGLCIAQCIAIGYRVTVICLKKTAHMLHYCAWVMMAAILVLGVIGRVPFYPCIAVALLEMWAALVTYP